MEKNIILRVEDITKTFAGIPALQNVDFSLGRAEVHALVGANGAGKSTLIKILTGAYQADKGKIFVENEEVKIHSPQDANQYGISAVYQEFSLINQLTVAENIYMGKLPCKAHGLVKKVDWQKVNSEAKAILDMMGVTINPKSLVGHLSVAQKQIVEIAKALSNNSKILIMDEPTASLTDNDIDNMLEVVRGLVKKGISIIYVSHRLEELALIADRISVFRDGRYITTIPISEAPKDVIIEHMVGRRVSLEQRKKQSTDEVLMKIRDFNSGIKFRDISFDLKKGEILGLTGLAGAGRTELVRALFGADNKDKGKVYIDNTVVDIRTPIDAKKYGIGFVTEDRKEEGLILGQTIKSNMSLTILNALSPKLVINQKQENELAEEYVKSLSIKTSGVNQVCRDLSGGNQQKVVIAKWLATKPKVLIMDEPTRGIDVGAKDQIYELMDQLVKEGISIIVISSDIPEILQVADRILVMAAGRITADLDNVNLTQELILHYATLQEERGNKNGKSCDRCG